MYTKHPERPFFLFDFKMVCSTYLARKGKRSDHNTKLAVAQQSIRKRDSKENLTLRTDSRS